MTVINPNSISGITSITLPSGDGNVLTIHTNDGTERFRIDSSGNVKVGSAATISPDGDLFVTGVTTTGGHFAGSGANLTNLPAANITGTLPAISAANLTNIPAANVTGTLPAISGANLTNLDASDLASGTIPDARFPATLPAVSGANLTGMAAGGAFVKGVIGVTTLTPVGIETSTVTRQDLIGPGGNTSTGAGSSFHGAYIGDGFLSFNTDFSNPTGYYISTFTNSLVAGPMSLGSTMTIDGTFTIV